MKTSIIRLTSSTKKLLKIMSFPEIPEEAHFVAFTEDGEAQFIEEIDGLHMAKLEMIVVSCYEDVEITVE